MISFRRALDAGADGVEFDVQRTSDGELVVIHDALLDRTTDGSGAVLQTTSGDIARLDAGSWFGSEFAAERVPRLEEVFGLDAGVLELEFKAWGRALLDGVLGAVDRAGVFERVKFTGWDLGLLGTLRARRPSARIGLFTQRPQAWMTDAVFEQYVVGMAETSPATVVHVYAGALTERIVEQLHELGFEVHANDAADKDEMQHAVDVGVDSISANDVEAAVRVCRPAR